MDVKFGILLCQRGCALDNETNINFEQIKNLYDSCGEHKKIYEGLFSNYLKKNNYHIYQKVL